jgi:hypothetical protein
VARKLKDPVLLLKSDSKKYAIISGLLAAAFISLIIVACLCPPVAAAVLAGVGLTGLIVGCVATGVVAGYFLHKCASNIVSSATAHYFIKARETSAHKASLKGHLRRLFIASRILHPLSIKGIDRLETGMNALIEL